MWRFTAAEQREATRRSVSATSASRAWCGGVGALRVLPSGWGCKPDSLGLRDSEPRQELLALDLPGRASDRLRLTRGSRREAKHRDARSRRGQPRHGTVLELDRLRRLGGLPRLHQRLDHLGVLSRRLTHRARAGDRLGPELICGPQLGRGGR